MDNHLQVWQNCISRSESGSAFSAKFVVPNKKFDSDLALVLALTSNEFKAKTKES